MRLRRCLDHDANQGLGAGGSEESPFDYFSREQWDQLADRSPLPLTHNDLSRLASLGDPINIAEVDAIYRPLTDAQAEATCVGTTTSVWGSLSSRSAATSSRAGYMRE